MSLAKNALNLCRNISKKLDFAMEYSPLNGVNCLGYSDKETEAMAIVCQAAKELGAKPFMDQGGNIIALLEGSNPKKKAALVGSHIDAVPNGGQYDGRAGVLLALGILQMMKDHKIELEHDYGLVIFRAEESPRFGKGLLGSLLATGQLDIKDFDRKCILGTEKTVYEAIESQGLNAQKLINKMKNKIPLFPLGHIGAFFEMHIEQSDIILNDQADLGLVTAIRGNLRSDIKLLGVAGHTGGTKQFIEMPNGSFEDKRSEASRGIIEIGYKFSIKCQKIAESGRDIVFSIPFIETPNASFTKICAEASSRFEARSADIEVLKELKAFLETEISETASLMGLKIASDVRHAISAPVTELSGPLIRALDESAESFSLKSLYMISGAGHDTMNMARSSIPSAMIFVPHSGPSHVPHEDMVLNKGDKPYAVGSPFENALKTMYATQIGLDMPFKNPEDEGKSFLASIISNGARLF